jgi:hypothetical protein
MTKSIFMGGIKKQLKMFSKEIMYLHKASNSGNMAFAFQESYQTGMSACAIDCC